ncbi:hypothetical protein Tdes44962_MAKER00587 [Teratosphaeria destructans]|uniref:Myb/SANT-like domain-containing protein n=1 Tax=Teratosphaeria destructans TaxID=418781 RepID=A0A9W7SNI1_9PEZI|nr:hypothetical protein Tdes44962_MAKER00587 [Teratosphaeria destructans]
MDDGATTVRGRGYTTFSHEIIGALLDELLLPERMPARLEASGKYRVSDYRRIALALNARYGSALAPIMIKSKVSDLKKLWRRWCTHLRHVSTGPWTGDPPRSLDHVEEEHFRENRDCRHFSHGRKPPHPEKLAALFGELLAPDPAAGTPSSNHQSAQRDTLSRSTIPGPSLPETLSEPQSRAQQGVPSPRPARRADERSSAGPGSFSSSRRLANVDVRVPLSDIVRSLKPQESNVTRAVRRLDGLELVRRLDPNDRFDLMEAVSVGTRADIVVGIINNVDLETWAGCLMDRIRQHRQPPPEQLFSEVMR